MILPDFDILEFRNLQLEYSGMDHPDYCRAEEHFKNYTKKVHYQYNSRGFRDREWPANPQLRDCVWCFGDSFTAGVGSPETDTWVRQVEQALGRPCINISLDGANNQWIAEKIQRVQQEINPPHIIVQWSYFHRVPAADSDFDSRVNAVWETFYDNIRDSSWPDCADHKNFVNLPEKIKQEIVNDFGIPEYFQFQNSELIALVSKLDNLRLAHHAPWITSTHEEDLARTLDNIKRVQRWGETKILHSCVPLFAPKHIRNLFYQHMADKQYHHIPEFQALDIARDGWHYDIKTSEKFAGLVKAHWHQQNW
jgi:hypothetical protein